MDYSLPFRLEFGEYVLVEWIGEPSVENIKLAQRTVLANPLFRKGMPAIIVDKFSAYNPSQEDIQQMALETGRHRDQFGPIAMVFTSKLHFGLGNMFRAYGEIQGLRCGVFYRLEDAVAWVREAAANPPPAQFRAGAS
jgi:hypothetical protein